MLILSIGNFYLWVNFVWSGLGMGGLVMDWGEMKGSLWIKLKAKTTIVSSHCDLNNVVMMQTIANNKFYHIKSFRNIQYNIFHDTFCHISLNLLKIQGISWTKGAFEIIYETAAWI